MLIDVTRPIRPDMAVFPGDPSPELLWDSRIEEGAVAALSSWRLGSHTGTHVDAPSHFILGGGNLGSVPLDALVGECQVIDVEDDAGLVTAVNIMRAHDWKRDPCDRVLLRTRNSLREDKSCFDSGYVALDTSAVDLLIALEVGTVGIDDLSVERYVDETSEPDYDYPVHQRLLGSGVTIIEGLDLSDVTAGKYRLICLPLSTPDTEAAPARVVLETL